MKQKLFVLSALLTVVILLAISCQKEGLQTDNKQNPLDEKVSSSANQNNLSNPPYDLNVRLVGACNEDESEDDCPVGHLKFRQDPDPEKIIDLNVKVHNLLPDHEYLFQRAVDAINQVDGNCTSTTWLTLGKGLTPQSIVTDSQGNGEEDLWRDVTAVPSGSKFDIHFQIIDAATNVVVLTSDCYQYQVR